jgi:small subunit ribosomal protein S19
MKRSKKKGPFTLFKQENKTCIIKTSMILKRSFEITSKIIGLTCQVYDGKNFLKLNISENMVGHKLGEFAPTRGKFIFKKKKKK